MSTDIKFGIYFELVSSLKRGERTYWHSNTKVFVGQEIQSLGHKNFDLYTIRTILEVLTFNDLPQYIATFVEEVGLKPAYAVGKDIIKPPRKLSMKVESMM